MKLEEINKEFQPIESSNVLTNDEMKETLGGDCGCKNGCATGCKPGMKYGDNEEQR